MAITDMSTVTEYLMCFNDKRFSRGILVSILYTPETRFSERGCQNPFVH